MTVREKPEMPHAKCPTDRRPFAIPQSNGREPFVGSNTWISCKGTGQSEGCVMTEHTELAITPRDRFLKAAEKELIAFERREREFLKKDREERAAKLQIPLNILTRN
jgi:hypothetical protein